MWRYWSAIIDDILALLNKHGLTSHQSQNLLERLGRIIEMGQRVTKGMAQGSKTLERLEVEARELRIPGVLRKARVPTRWDAT